MIQSPHGKAVINLNYKTLRKVEVLMGYETDANGSPLLKKPKWAPLTEEAFANTEEDLLCRIVKYEDESFGVQEAAGLRLPVYNRYFIIGNSAGAATAMRRVRRAYQDKLTQRISRNTRQHRNLSSEYLATTSVGSRRIRTRPATRRRVLKNLDLSRRISQVNRTRMR